MVVRSREQIGGDQLRSTLNAALGRYVLCWPVTAFSAHSAPHYSSHYILCRFMSTGNGIFAEDNSFPNRLGGAEPWSNNAEGIVPAMMAGSHAPYRAASEPPMSHYKSRPAPGSSVEGLVEELHRMSEKVCVYKVRFQWSCTAKRLTLYRERQLAC